MVTGRFEVNLVLERKREGCDKKKTRKVRQ